MKDLTVSPHRRTGLNAGDVTTRSLGDILGSGWTRLGLWAVALAAALVDVGTFYQVLVTVLDAPERVVWVVVFGFAAVALTLAHWAGWQSRQHRDPRSPHRSRLLAVLLFAVWFGLGVLAFVIRYQLAQADSSDTSTVDTNGAVSTVSGGIDETTEHYAALFFFMLYIATGAVAAVAGYFRPDPAARQVGRAQRRRARAARRHARTAQQYTRVERTAEKIEQARRRREVARQATEDQCRSAAERLKAQACLFLRRSAPAPAHHEEASS
ncbi:hypothetical protein ABIA35_006394 [Catenulispora sp. MAP12-49]|uniref:hypothetical protein n=1 Tax=unclassified Catenulispora TaxID=414885 RepID=UPI0035126DB7